MAAHDTLMSTLRSRLPSAMDGLIELELFNTIDELCRATNAYREMIATDLIEGQGIYTIEPGDREILLVYETAHPTMTVFGSVFDAGQIAVPVAPTEEDLEYPLLTSVSMTPRIGGAVDPASWLPQLYYERFHQALLDGVQGRMMSQIAKPYTNPQGALYHLRRFRNAIRILGSTASNDSEPGAQRWVFPAFA